jgi:hypothetical protein
VIDAFVAEHHVERPFHKRERDRADPEALARAPAERARMTAGNFIARWSRRKRGRARRQRHKMPSDKPAATRRCGRAPEDQGGARDVERAHGGAGEPAACDLTKLPPIESITADSDIRAFLAPGVPPEFTRAALRRAWSADPKIRDFVGLSENAWDFNAPGSMAGFGPLEMTDELRREVARMVGRSLAGEDSERPAPTAAEDKQTDPRLKHPDRPPQPPGAHTQPRAIVKLQNDPAAADNEQHNSTPALQRSKVILRRNMIRNPITISDCKRPHGSALPKG